MKFHGVLGVSLVSVILELPLKTEFQEKQLYISDPKALYYIYIKVRVRKLYCPRLVTNVAQEYESYAEPEAFYV